MIPKTGELYRHFKGDFYKIIAIATHSETGEQMVVYQAMYGAHEYYVRPLDMFISKVDRQKYPDADQEYRFELAQDNDMMTPEEIAQEQSTIDPLILEFLDSDTYTDKKNILTALHHKITNEMINTLAASLDIVIEDGALEERYSQLYNCLTTRDRYECNRI